MSYRAVLYVVVLACALALIGPTPARADEGIDHATLVEGELAPGTERSYRLTFSEGELRAGWLFTVSGQIHSGVADLTLLDPAGEQVGRWRWEPTEQPRWEGLALPHDGTYTLRIDSTGSDLLRYTFYYDQSCFCSGKQLPLEGGVIVFQSSAVTGTEVESWLSLDSGMETSVQVAYRTAPAGRWPDDYRLLPVTPHVDEHSGDTYRQEAISFRAESSDPFYVIVQSRKGTGTVSFLAQEGSQTHAHAHAPEPEPLARPELLPLVAGLAGGVAVVVSLLSLLRLRQLGARDRS